MGKYLGMIMNNTIPNHTPTEIWEVRAIQLDHMLEQAKENLQPAERRLATMLQDELAYIVSETLELWRISSEDLNR